jgi:hypothetical protein
MCLKVGDLVWPKRWKPGSGDGLSLYIRSIDRNAGTFTGNICPPKVKPIQDVQEEEAIQYLKSGGYCIQAEMLRQIVIKKHFWDVDGYSYYDLKIDDFDTTPRSERMMEQGNGEGEGEL